MQTREDTAQKLYDWLYDHADEDGNVEASSPSIALQLGKPLRTVQGAAQRLEDKYGLIATIARGHYVVVEIADPWGIFRL